MTADERPVPFETGVDRLDGVTVLSVRGEVDLSTAPQLKIAIDAALTG